MKTSNNSFVSILDSTLRIMTTKRVRRFAAPMSAAFLLAGCASFEAASEVDERDLAGAEQELVGDEQELALDDDAEDIVSDLADDQDSARDTAAESEDDEDLVVAPMDDSLVPDLADFAYGYDFHDEVDPESLSEAGRLLLESELVDESPGNPIQWSPPDASEIAGGAPVPMAPLQFSACTSSMTGCVLAGNAAAKIACGADLFAIVFGQVELAPALSAWCYAALFAQGGACVAAGGFCNAVPTSPTHPAADPPHRQLVPAGENYGDDTEKSANCPKHERVKTVKVWKQKTSAAYISQIQLVCTDNTTITYGTKASTDIGASMPCDQSKGKLVSGLRMRHGFYIDAVGARCQTVGYDNNTTGTEFPVSNYALWGGTGGDLQTFECPAHQYLRGMKAHYTTIASGKVINYVRPHCR